MSSDFIPAPKPYVQVIPSHETAYRDGFQDRFAAADMSAAGFVLCGYGMVVLLLACGLLARHTSRLVSTLCRYLDRLGEDGSRYLKSCLLPLLVCIMLTGCAEKHREIFPILPRFRPRLRMLPHLRTATGPRMPLRLMTHPIVKMVPGSIWRFTHQWTRLPARVRVNLRNWHLFWNEGRKKRRQHGCQPDASQCYQRGCPARDISDGHCLALWPACEADGTP